MKTIFANQVFTIIHVIDNANSAHTASFHSNSQTNPVFVEGVRALILTILIKLLITIELFIFYHDGWSFLGLKQKIDKNLSK